MTTAVSEILKQVEQLSDDEQFVLVASLTEQLEQSTESAERNDRPPRDVDSVSQTQQGSEADLPAEPDDGKIPDVFSLNRVPPQRTYTMRVRYKFVGPGKPKPYPLSDER